MFTARSRALSHFKVKDKQVIRVICRLFCPYSLNIIPATYVHVTELCGFQLVEKGRYILRSGSTQRSDISITRRRIRVTAQCARIIMHRSNTHDTRSRNM